jgi:autotransporter-associated beta strand protein
MICKKFLLTALVSSMLLVGCGGNDSTIDAGDNSAEIITVPAVPKGLGYIDTAPVLSTVPAVVDQWATNQRGDARYATVSTNAGVRVLDGFLKVWKPTTELVDAGVTAEARDGFPAITASLWNGLPYSENDGTKLNTEALEHNIQYSENRTKVRTEAEAVRAYLDDRRGKNYSVTSGMGALTDPWRNLTGQTTSINDVPLDATTVKYDDKGSNNGLTTAQGNEQFGKVVEFVSAMGVDSSTEPAKRFYKYARPYRWSNAVSVVPALEPAKSSTPGTDGGFPSGHTAEAGRNAIAMAYLVPQRYQEIIARGLDLGDSRIIAGMHSAFDVIGGRIQSIAADVANLNRMTAEERAVAYNQAQTGLMIATNTKSWDEFSTLAKQPYDANDRFADLGKIKILVKEWMTYGFKQISASGVQATVPKGAEVLLETRFPYLDADQRRVVLKSTAVDSGYPVMDDAEGFGRLDLFSAGAGYGNFNGDVYVNMDASHGGFNTKDIWSNDISGAGKLTKSGTGELILSGNNIFSGGIEVQGGTISAVKPQALGKGDVYVKSGILNLNSVDLVTISGKLTIQDSSLLRINLNSASKSYLKVNDLLTLKGSLELKSAENLASGTYILISAQKLQGKFSKATLNGKEVTIKYQNNQVILTI